MGTRGWIGAFRGHTRRPNASRLGDRYGGAGTRSCRSLGHDRPTRVVSWIEYRKSTPTRRGDLPFKARWVGGGSSRCEDGIALLDGLMTRLYAAAPADAGHAMYAPRSVRSHEGRRTNNVRSSACVGCRLGDSWLDRCPPRSHLAARRASVGGVGTVWLEIAAVGLLAMRGRHVPCGGSDRGWARFTGFVEQLYFRLVKEASATVRRFRPGPAPPLGLGDYVRVGRFRHGPVLSPLGLGASQREPAQLFSPKVRTVPRLEIFWPKVLRGPSWSKGGVGPPSSLGFGSTEFPWVHRVPLGLG